MSTNYYAFGPFPGGEESGEGLHIGQTAAGWRFLFRAHKKPRVASLLDWRTLLHQDATAIRDEYSREYTPDAMIEIVTRTHDTDGQELLPRFGARTAERLLDGHHLDPDGHAFYNGDFC